MRKDQHPLSAWIENHTTRGEFARAIGCSESHLSNILARRKRPSVDLLASIAKATQNHYGLSDFARGSEA